jgi:hypothetical protein
MAALKVEGERWDGEEEPIDCNSLPVTDSTPTANGTLAKAPAPPATKLLSTVITAYFKEHKREPRTDSQIKSVFEKFTKAIGGDCPIGEITKEKCKDVQRGHGGTEAQCVFNE